MPKGCVTALRAAALSASNNFIGIIKGFAACFLQTANPLKFLTVYFLTYPHAKQLKIKFAIGTPIKPIIKPSVNSRRLAYL